MDKITKEKAFVFLDKTIEILLYAMIFFIPISIAAIEIIFSFSMFLLTFKKILKPDFKFINNSTHIFLLLFFGFCAFSLFKSGIYFTKSLTALFGKWLEYILIFILVEDTLNTPQRLRNAIIIFLGTAGLISLDAIYQKFSGIDFIRQRHLVYGLSATFRNENSLAAYLLPNTIILTILLFSQSKAAQICNKFLLFFLYIFSNIVLILTFCRSVWLGFILGLSLWVFLSKSIKKGLLPICIFIIVLFLTPLSQNRIMSAFSPTDKNFRAELFSASWKMIKDCPFLGHGLGTYMDYFSRYSGVKNAYYAHNCFLQIWAETGIYSLLSFILFIGLILNKGIKVFRRINDYPVLLLTCAMFVLLVNSFFDVLLYSVQLAALFWFILGLLVAATKIAGYGLTDSDL